MSKKFESLDSLKSVERIINEANNALNSREYTITTSPISDVLLGGLGAGIGGVASFTALYGLGVTGLSAAGITSGLATAGSLVAGGMVSGIFVLAAPVALLAGIGVAVSNNMKNTKLVEEKERLLKEAIIKHEAIILELESEMSATKERVDALKAINIFLLKAIEDLGEDLGKSVSILEK